jgi:putative transposase
MKRRNPRFGYQRIADQISHTFDIDIGKDVVRRVLATHYNSEPGSGGPSWLTFLGHSKDSLWSVDLFRCESIILRSHWVMVVMDHYSRRIIGIAVHAGTVDGRTLCCLFNRIISGSAPPRYLSSDNDPLFTFHRWRANLRILDIEEIKTMPYVPLSHPFIDRLIGTVRREFLDHVPFWGAVDLERKLNLYMQYYNTNRTHRALNGTPPAETIGQQKSNVVRIHNYRWQNHCRGLYQLPVAA